MASHDEPPSQQSAPTLTSSKHKLDPPSPMKPSKRAVVMATPNTAGATARITREIANLQTGSDLSLAVACKDSDVRDVRALIIGPPDTPYEFGFFQFEIKFSHEYPIKCPSVRSVTTNSGRTRFNPNIYNCGKVCLSILGTWRGERGEEWSSAQGLESVLLSIQSLMSANPYENEPGYEESKKDEKLPQAYIAKIRHETIRLAVIQPLEALMSIDDPTLTNFYRQLQLGSSISVTASSQDGISTPGTTDSSNSETGFSGLESATWEPFADLLKRRFLWYYDTYAKTISEASTKHKHMEEFKQMEFEYPPNAMRGNFDYAGLEKRLKRLATALEDECQKWEQEGKAQVEKQTQLATQLAFQYRQLSYRWNESGTTPSKVEISLPDPGNPFIWNLTLFGKPMTNLDSGVFNLTLSIPPDFPDAQPRVRVQTPIFHYRVASSGHLCYFPKKEDDIASHLEAIVEAIEDENPTYDPRALINPDAFALFWGGEEKRKIYHRRLRRSAHDSSGF